MLGAFNVFGGNSLPHPEAILGKIGEHVAIQVLIKYYVEMLLTRSSSFSCWVFPGGSLLREISLRNELYELYNFTKSVEKVLK